VVNELKSFQVKVDLVDPYASSEEMHHEYGVSLVEIGKNYDAIIVAVNHKDYKNLDENYFKSLMKDSHGVFVDIKGIYKGKIKDLEYWSL
jgi:UDP-N-acetyl-D-galactosamine dehydrogenase